MSLEAAITQEGGAPPGGIPLRVRRALISVSEKTGVVDFARGLTELGVQILSTGGTAAAIREAGIEVTDVAEFTGSPEILDGRVKTLHPRLHAALLARRDDSEHMATLEAEGIEPIDLVCVNLYPFEQTVARLGRERARGGREHRHRRPDDDPRGGQEPQRGRGARPPRGLRRGARGAARVQRRDLDRDPPVAGERGVRPHGRLRRGDLALVRRSATRRSRSTG